MEIMTLGFIKAIEAGDWDTLYIKCIPFVVCMVCDTIAMCIDLIAGVRKAKQLGKFSTSDGYKRTVDKALRYWSLLILCFLIDVIMSIFVQVPYFTILGGLYIMFIEVKSWFEKASEKERRDIVQFADIIKNKEDLSKAIANAIKETLKDKENESIK